MKKNIGVGDFAIHFDASLSFIRKHVINCFSKFVHLPCDKMATTGADYSQRRQLRSRTKLTSDRKDEDLVKDYLNDESAEEQEKRAKYEDSKEFVESLKKLESIFAPIFFTILSFVVRLYKIGINNHVVWDEAHFGKFGSYYLRHEFYHDVHPPLGKMLIGLSGYLVGYNGSWDFNSGETYPSYIDYTKMRVFNATFSALCVPLAYYTLKQVGFSIASTWLFTLMVCLELSYITLGKFILLDSMLLFFTISTVFCFLRFHTINSSEKSFTRKWWKWLLLTGFSIGCTCSVKMVGLLSTALVGIYTVVDLWVKLGDKKMKWSVYIRHWLARIFCLIIIPLLVFMASFKVHFDLLYKTGTGDANMSSLFQANLLGSDVVGGAREVTMGHSVVTLKSQGLTGGLLHSHVQTFPEGSKQQQVTTYSHKDANNHWIFQRARGLPNYDTETSQDIEYIIDGMEVRLVHPLTGRNLHTHSIAAPLSKSEYEVACYGNLTIGDYKDNWIVEVVDQQGDEDKLRLHPLTTSFRLKNAELGCYLGVSGHALPPWGFRQGEVVCYKDPFRKDKRTWWNIENNENKILPPAPADFKLPKTRFWKDFIQINLAMMATNNALLPETDKQDDLASSAWQWPTLHSGIRMCTWADDIPKYFLIGSISTTWTSSVALIIFMFVVLYYLIRWQRQFNDFPASEPKKFDLFIIGGVYPLLGWFLHFFPFVIMGRITYVHHYLPALYFAMFVLCYLLELFTSPLTKSTKPSAKLTYALIYAAWYAFVIGVFWRWRHISFGLIGPKENYSHLDLLPSWRIANDNYT